MHSHITNPYRYIHTINTSINNKQTTVTFYHWRRCWRGKGLFYSLPARYAIWQAKNGEKKNGKETFHVRISIHLLQEPRHLFTFPTLIFSKKRSVVIPFRSRRERARSIHSFRFPVSCLDRHPNSQGIRFEDYRWPTGIHSFFSLLYFFVCVRVFWFRTKEIFKLRKTNNNF